MSDRGGELTGTEFSIKTVGEAHTYLQVYNEDAGINILVEVYSEEIEQLRDELPEAGQ